MIGLLCFALAVLASPFKSKLRLESENAVLRHQLIVLRRRLHGRVWLTNHDRWFLIQLYRWVPSILQVLTIIRPETLVRWHRAGFRCYWRWKARRLGGRPQIDTELRVLIRRMSVENPLWGAPRIHGELLKLGFEVAQSSVAKYMVKRRGPPSQGWRTFLRNHAPDIAAMDLFVVPTIGFDLFYAFVIVRLGRRDLVWINVTANPTAEWVARQFTEASRLLNKIKKVPPSDQADWQRGPNSRATARYDAGEGEQRPIVIQREPHDVLFAGGRIRLRRIIRKAIGRDHAAIFRLQPAAPMRRCGVADVGDRRPAELRRGGIPQRIIASSRSAPAVWITGAEQSGNTPGIWGRLPIYRLITRNSAMIAA